MSANIFPHRNTRRQKHLVQQGPWRGDRGYTALLPTRAQHHLHERQNGGSLAFCQRQDKGKIITFHRCAFSIGQQAACAWWQDEWRGLARVGKGWERQSPKTMWGVLWQWTSDTGMRNASSPLKLFLNGTMPGGSRGMVLYYRQAEQWAVQAEGECACKVLLNQPRLEESCSLGVGCG